MIRPSIQILDTDLSNKHSISSYISLEFTRAWNSQGYFKLVINKENKTAKYLAVDKILYIDEKRIGYIKKKGLSKKSNKANSLLVIEGVELKDELARITYPDAGQATDSYSNQYTETIVKELIKKNAGINVNNANRQIPGLEVATDISRGSQVVFSTRYKDIMSEVYKLLRAELMGLKCGIDFDTSKIIFDVAEGNDKKAVLGSKVGVVLSVDLKTADEVHATEDKSSYKNVAITAGLGAGAERTIQEVGDTDKVGYLRSETFVDARDISSDAELTERGNQRLAETKIVKGKTIKFNEAGPRKLDEAFMLGDFITADIDGEYEDAQVIKVTEAYKDTKPPKISLVLDFDYLDTLAKKMKVASENNINVVAKENSTSSDSSSANGWIEPAETWEYDSPTTFKVDGDVRDKYGKGDKLMWTQGDRDKQSNIISDPDYSGGKTTIEIHEGYISEENDCSLDMYADPDNEIGNPRFIGTTGWNPYSAILSASGNVLFIEGDGGGQYVQGKYITGLVPVSGHKVYAKTRGRVTNGDANRLALYFDGTASGTNTNIDVVFDPDINEFYNLSGIATIPADMTGYVEFRIYHIYDDAPTANGKIAEVLGTNNYGVFFIDLTARYGAGNEPSKELCDILFSGDISNNQYSKIENPQNFIHWFSWTPVYTGFSTDPSNAMSRFMIKGACLYFHHTESVVGISNNTIFRISVPVKASSSVSYAQTGPVHYVADAGVAATTPGRWAIGAGGANLVLYKDSASGAFTAAGGKGARLTGFYEI